MVNLCFKALMKVFIHLKCHSTALTTFSEVLDYSHYLYRTTNVNVLLLKLKVLEKKLHRSYYVK